MFDHRGTGPACLHSVGAGRGGVVLDLPILASRGYIGLPQAYDAHPQPFRLRHSSRGPDTVKVPNLHTAMKVMDYMCCAVPVWFAAAH